MISKNALRELARRVAHDLDILGHGTALSDLGQSLAAEAGAATALTELFAADAAKKRPSPRLLSAYILMLGHTLATVRDGLERGLPEALNDAEAARAAMLAVIAGGVIGGSPLAILLRAFALARLDPGAAVRVAVAARATEPASPPVAGFVDASGGDAFRLQAEIAARAAAPPDRARAALLGAADPRLREAAVGWLLDGAPVARAAAAEGLRRAAVAGGVSGVMLRRMITVRNWIPAPDRPALDGAILAARQAGAEVAPLAAPALETVQASGFDGSGAQSLVAVVRDGRRRAALAVLFKLGLGVGDAWVQTGLTAAAAKTAVARMDDAVIVTDLDYLRLALPHLLARGVASGQPPPFGLVDVVERLGLSAINPAPLPLPDLLGYLLLTLPAVRRSPAEVERAVEASATWYGALTFVASWFEGDAAALAAAAGLHLSQARRRALILDHVLPARRDWWAELMAWTALALRGQRPRAPMWIDMALVAREIHRGRPPAEIPIMNRVAAATVEAWGARC